MTSSEKKWAAWESLRKEYETELTRRSRQQERRHTILSKVTKFWDWMRLCVLLPQELEPIHFLDYCQDLRNGRLCRLVESYEESTQASLRGAAIRWVRWLDGRGHILTDPFQEFSANEPQKAYSTGALSRYQVQQILESPNLKTDLGLRDLALFEVAYGSGLRVAELSRLTLNALDLENRIVHLKVSKNGWGRAVPLTKSAVKSLQRYLTESRPYLLQPGNPPAYYQALWHGVHKTKNKPLSISGMQQIAERYSDYVGFHWSFHTLRHTCATHLLEGGAGAAVIAKMLGHNCLDSTALYAQLQLQELRDALTRYHPRF